MVEYSIQCLQVLTFTFAEFFRALKSANWHSRIYRIRVLIECQDSLVGGVVSEESRNNR